ncbi:MAG: type I-C CRISPR-associated protein Cas5c [Syntrophobacteraceae bacterium]
MAHGVKLRVWGDYACYSRPELKVERGSYDVITPSAARGILEAIYWKPEIRWIVERIRVLRPIRFTNIRRNEVASKVSVANVKRAMKSGRGNLGIFIEEDRQQRAALILQDVDYIIEARFEVVNSGDPNTGKHKEIFTRRARSGQCFHRPYLGCREFPASFLLVEGDPPASQLTGETDLGWMLHDIDFQNGMQPRFFRARMVNGVIDVPPFESREVRG